MQRNTSFVGTTTPREKTSFFAIMVEYKDPSTGKPLFNVTRVSQPCEECQRKGDPWTCSHIEDDTSWKDKRKISKYSSLYSDQGLDHINKREQFGMESDNSLKAFSEENVLDIRNKPLYDIYTKPKVIYLASDPSGGGGSGYAFAAAIIEQGKFIVSISWRGFFLFMYILSLHLYPF